MKTPPAVLAGLSVILCAGAAAAQNAPSAMHQSRDWSAALREDATALHAAIIGSHPGVHDTLNPMFRDKVDASLSQALGRAGTTTDAGGWWWAMRSFVAGFDDGHVQLGLTDQSFSFPTRWPGFLTTYRGGDAIVASRDDTDGNTPPIGARLVECDGVSADQLAEDRIGEFRGRWFLESQRTTFGSWLFMSASNPWVPEMQTCRFEIEGGVRAWSLNWRPIEASDLSTRRRELLQRPAAVFGVEALDDGGVWVSMPSFNGTPGSEAHTALTAMLDEMGRKQGELRAAPYVVLDLRGNGGGSSHWSAALATILWGEDWLRGHTLPPIEAIEWRASEPNLATIQGYLDEWTAAGEDAERIAWARRIVDGMTEARAAGRPYWRSVATTGPEVTSELNSPLLVGGRVYVLTDPACASACLDAVDIWKAAGAVQIGRETSADTVYMDTRTEPLPSGLANLTLPMKVWRGRQRGNNEPQRPAHVFDGDMSDSAALRVWIRSLT
ncbi:S41 family peptidase [Brevundimonas basaltis]|uniref:Peptidase family S41 n=1 Tax=Brevundimonas basaltis TaxID=472166 RepID=A0A7W8MGV0_9CAUL|nr:S41 family peptidase [Brevundimonas basaltis]MBB5291567.1 hypothetical protein [Brevundimonas basaltis]